LYEDMLLDRIYEAGALPELWPRMLEDLSTHAEGAGALLFSVSGTSFHWTASQQVHELAGSYIEKGYLGNDSRTERLVAANHPGFLTDLDVFTPQEWEADPIRVEHFIPRGFGWGAATEIKMPTLDIAVIHVERELADGPFTPDIVARLDRLRPHLARAALMSTRIAFERVKGAMAALEVVGIPAAVLDGRARMIATNSLMEELIPAVVAPRPARIAFANAAADRMLSATLDAVAAAPNAPVPHSIPIPAAPGAHPVVAHLHPIRRAARDVFTNASAILLLTPLNRRDMPSSEVIGGLFDLTPAEARVARALSGGGTVEGIAATGAVSVATVRNQLRSVFAKTGVNRQADLVGLLQGIASPFSTGGRKR